MRGFQPRRRGLAWVAGAAGIVLAAGPVSAQVFRIEDEAGVIHYTNQPCAPQYVRLAPNACPTSAPDAGSPVVASEPAPGLAHEIETMARRYGVDERLVEAIVQVESGGNPRAVSPKGAQGLMQLMPARASTLGVADVFDPRANLDGGVRHLRDLLLRYDGNVRLALAAYNAGEEAVRLHGGVPPYRETREYVRKVLARYVPATSGSRPTPPAQPAPARARF